MSRVKDFIRERIRTELIVESRIPFKMALPHSILKLKSIFKQNGHKLFVVGGAVRDALLGKVPKDFDLATDALPDVVENMMAKAGIRTIATGKAFGVINVFIDNDEFEIATFREDIGSSDSRRPDEVRFTNIENDVKRRDLTINALFYDIETNEVVDLVGGVDDLKSGIVRTVGKPEERFGEDRLRILRAIRFAARFGSDLDPATDAALKKDASLQKISAERIRKEFLEGITSAKSVVHFMQMLDKYGLFDWIFKNLRVDKDFIESKDILVVLAILLRSNDTGVLNKQLNVLKYSVDEIRGVIFLLKLLKLSPDTVVALKRVQNTSGVSDAEILLFGQKQGINIKLLQAFIKFKLTVSGEELMQSMGLQPGKELGDTIQKLETQNFLKLL